MYKDFNVFRFDVKAKDIDKTLDPDIDPDLEQRLHKRRGRGAMSPPPECFRIIKLQYFWPMSGWKIKPF